MHGDTEQTSAFRRVRPILNVRSGENRATAVGRKRPVAEMAGVGFGVVLRAGPCQRMRWYCCITGVTLAGVDVGCVLM